MDENMNIRSEVSQQPEPPSADHGDDERRPRKSDDVRPLSQIVCPVAPVDRKTVEGFYGVLDFLPNSLCVIDSTGEILFTNHSWRNFSDGNGGNSNSCRKINYLTVVEGVEGAEVEDSAVVSRGLRDMLSGKLDVFEHVYPCHSPSGEKRWFKLQATPFFDGALMQHFRVEDPGISGSNIREILSYVAHELATPVNSIKGYSELLQMRAASQPPEVGADPRAPTSRYYSAISDASEYLSGIIRDMLMVRQAADPLESMRLSEETCSAEGLLASSIGICSSIASQRSVNIMLLRCDHDGADHVNVDKIKIRQALVNIISNACKYSPQGSAVVCQFRRNPSGGIEFDVIDCGPGLTDEEIPVALSPYGRTEAATKSGVTGLGLGLPLTKALVDLHGGILKIQRRQAKGLQVSIVLPGWRTIAGE